MTSTTLTSPRPVVREMRLVLISASILVFAMGVMLFVLPGSTARYFAWTVNPPITAAFMGAGFLAAGVLELLSAKEHRWANARPGVPAVLLFTIVMLSVTLYHIDRFHTGQPQAWLWIGVYVLFPPLMIVASAVQLRGSGSDLTDPEPLPGWFRVVISLQAVVLAGVGVLLLAVPLTVAPHWPWTLSALTGRAIGAWLVGFGLAAGQSAIENDQTRVRNVALSSIVFAGLLFVAVGRFGGQIDWDKFTSWLFVIVLASVLLVGVVSISVLSRNANRQTSSGTAREEQ